MANPQRISVLDPVSILDGTEDFAVVKGGVTQRVTATIIKLFARTYPRTAGEIAVGITPVDYTYSPGNVLRFGADPTGAVDSTAAFNMATMGDYTSLGNDDLTFPGLVHVPAGEYRIDGTVYIHKGQHLRGDGEGATRIDLSNTSAFGDHIFKLGESSVTTDAGGLPPEISALWILGGPSSFAAIYSSAAGASIHNVFLTSVGTGIRLIGTDVRVSNVQIDQCLTGIQVGGHSHIFVNVLIYSPNFGITTVSGAGGGCYDIVFDNVQLYFVGFYGVSLSAGVDHTNISFNNCIMLLNAQFATFVTFFFVTSTAARSITISDSVFSNMEGPAVILSSGGANNEIKFNNVLFDGAKSVAAYTQSSTAYAAFVAGSECVFNDCEFRNLFAPPILTNGHVALTRVLVRGGIASNNAGTVFMDVSTIVPATGSQLMVENLWFKDERVQAFEPQPSWYIANDAGQVLTGIGASPILQFPSGRKSLFFIDTSSAVAQIYLPRTADNIHARPKHGDQLTFVDYAQDWGTNNVTFLRGDHTINGAAANHVESVDGARVTFTYNSVTEDWNAS